MSKLKIQENTKKLAVFRNNMGVELTEEMAKSIWSVDFQGLELEKGEIAKKKIDIVQRNIHKFHFFDWVRFIAITGSVAAGKAKEGDDIDVLIVTKNDRMWLYRLFLILKFGYFNSRRVWGCDVKDKIDTNFFCEERGITFQSNCIFTFHEILFMIPVYNEGFYNHIVSINHRLMNNFGVKTKMGVLNKKRSVLLIPNFIAFAIQILYMFLMGHSPDLKRILRNNKEGKIEFFPKYFRDEKVREYEKNLGSIKRAE